MQPTLEVLDLLSHHGQWTRSPFQDWSGNHLKGKKIFLLTFVQESYNYITIIISLVPRGFLFSVSQDGG